MTANAAILRYLTRRIFFWISQNVLFIMALVLCMSSFYFLFNNNNTDTNTDSFNHWDIYGDSTARGVDASSTSSPRSMVSGGYTGRAVVPLASSSSANESHGNARPRATSASSRRRRQSNNSNSNSNSSDHTSLSPRTPRCKQ